MKKGTKSHIINSLLTSFVRSVRESICPRFFPHRPCSFVARSLQKPQANTFPYRPYTRLISNQYYMVELAIRFVRKTTCKFWRENFRVDLKTNKPDSSTFYIRFTIENYQTSCKFFSAIIFKQKTRWIGPKN